MNHFSKSLGALLAGAVLCGCAPLTLHVVALNDFHGNLETNKMWQGPVAVQAGGAETIAAALQAWRREDPELLLVGAGDLVSASPALSSMWADEPTIGAMNLLGLRASALGNHEFDAGTRELMRLQQGGCDSPRPDKACQFRPGFEGARFPYLAANVRDAATGKLLVPAWRIEQAHGVKIGFIGAVTREAPASIMASNTAGLSFADEADAINGVLPELKAAGATVFVVLIHEGARDREAASDCHDFKGPIVDIVKRLDPRIRLIVSGHSHMPYACQVDGRMVTQADMGGHMLTRIALTLDARTREVTAVKAANVLLEPGVHAPDPAMTAFMAKVRERSTAALARPVATLAVPSIRRKGNEAGESALGDLIADAMLEATRELNVDVAFMNPGGIRKDLDAGTDLVLRYGQVQAVQPFGNLVLVLEMTGAQLRALLESQWTKGGDDKVLQVSRGFSYRWDAQAPYGQRVVAGSVMLNGAALDDRKTYRVAASNFLYGGGDGFTTFKEARKLVAPQLLDLDVLATYLARQGKSASADSAARIQRVN
ncbi:MAG: bifunctional metallophosphatase/5'-nucleotidase [Pseudomonadota bacterium]